MRRMLRAGVCWLWLGACMAAWSQPVAPLRPIAALDVPRYLGRWYEIAKFPNRFQQQCVADTSADYSLLGEGRLQVLNQCRLSSGEMQSALGQARQIGGGQSPRLQVRFAPAWLSFLPFVWGDYWVIDLDDRYELAAVSEPSRQYLWILARQPVVEPARYAALLERLSAQGLDVSRLQKSPQSAAAPKVSVAPAVPGLWPAPLR